MYCTTGSTGVQYDTVQVDLPLAIPVSSRHRLSKVEYTRSLVEVGEGNRI